MKPIAFLTLILVLNACGPAENKTTENSRENQADSAETAFIPTDTSAAKIELKEKNQVNDYATYFLQAKIFEDSEHMDWNSGDGHYYEKLDLKNGYAKVTGAYEGSYVFAIWRMANGNDLVGKTSAFCGPVCDYKHTFYEIMPEGEKDVTSTILPVKEIEAHRKKMEDEMRLTGDMDESLPTQLKFVLPQEGTSIDVYLSMNSNELEFIIMTLSWDKSTFKVSQKFDEIITTI